MKIKFITLAAKADPRASYGPITDKTYEHLNRMLGPLIALDDVLNNRVVSESKSKLVSKDKVIVGAIRSISLGKRGMHLDLADSKSTPGAFDAKLALSARFSHPGVDGFDLKFEGRTTSRYLEDLNKVSTARQLADELVATLLKNNSERLALLQSQVDPRVTYLVKMNRALKQFLGIKAVRAVKAKK